MSIERLSLRSNRRMVTAILALLVIPAIWYARTDFLLASQGFEHVGARVVCRILLISTCLTGIALMQSERTREAYARIVLAVALVVGVFLIAINSLRPKGSTLPLRTPLLTIAAAYGGMPNTFWRQIIPPLISTAGLILLRLTWVTSGLDGDKPGDIVAILTLNAIGILMVRRRLELEGEVNVAWSAEHEARMTSEQALADLNTLRGIIPICSHCKNVRTDVGEWEKVEWYVADHSDAEFSHGICPDCEKKYYTEHK